MNLVGRKFAEQLPATLHTGLVADEKECIVRNGGGRAAAHVDNWWGC